MSLISIGLVGFFGQFIPINVIFTISGTLIALAGLFGWLTIPKETQPIQTQQTWGNNNAN